MPPANRPRDQRHRCADDFHHQDHDQDQPGRPRHGRRNESDGFACIHCKARVSGSAWGTRQRNHCPACLHSKHVDDKPGDRASPCGGAMEPIAVAVRSSSDHLPGVGGEWVLVHRCKNCGQLKANRIAGDDSERALLALALRPLARPAFPIDDPSGA